jgi:hypothetical protein
MNRYDLESGVKVRGLYYEITVEPKRFNQRGKTSLVSDNEYRWKAWYRRCHSSSPELVHLTTSRGIKVCALVHIVV